MIGSTLVLLFAAMAQATEEPSRITAEDLEPIAKLGIERVLSRVLEVPVTVDSVKLLPDEERMIVKNVRIANPQGFEAPTALSADSVEIAGSIRTFFTRTPEIKLIQVAGAKVNAETRLPQGSNITMLMNNAKAARQGPLQGLQQQKQLRIQKGVLQGAEVNVGTQLLQSQNMQRKLGNIEMDFMGEDGRGMPAQQAMTKFLAKLVEELQILPRANGGAGILEQVAPLVTDSAPKPETESRPGKRLRDALKGLR